MLWVARHAAEVESTEWRISWGNSQVATLPHVCLLDKTAVVQGLLCY